MTRFPSSVSRCTGKAAGGRIDHIGVGPACTGDALRRRCDPYGMTTVTTPGEGWEEDNTMQIGATIHIHADDQLGAEVTEASHKPDRYLTIWLGDGITHASAFVDDPDQAIAFATSIIDAAVDLKRRRQAEIAGVPA